MHKGAAVERLARRVEEDLAVDRAVVVHERVGVLEADVIPIRLVIERHARERDLRAMQRHRRRHVEGNLRALGGLNRERLARIGEVSVQLVLARVHHDGLAVLHVRDRLVQRLVRRLADLGDHRRLCPKRREREQKHRPSRGLRE